MLASSRAASVLKLRITEHPFRKNVLLVQSRNRKYKGLGEMSDKKAIRVIKKGDLKRQVKPAEKATSARDTARDMVKTVTNWVNEMQQKRRAETAHAIKTLLPNTPRPSEA
jgi:hypothetical protein